MSLAPKHSANEKAETLYARLKPLTPGLPNDEILARMLASWGGGFGALPACLGLDRKIYRFMLLRHFPAIELPPPPRRGSLTTRDANPSGPTCARCCSITGPTPIYRKNG